MRLSWPQSVVRMLMIMARRWVVRRVRAQYVLRCILVMRVLLVLALVLVRVLHL